MNIINICNLDVDVYDGVFCRGDPDAIKGKSESSSCGSIP